MRAMGDSRLATSSPLPCARRAGIRPRGKRSSPSAGLRGQVSRRRTSRRESGEGGDCKDRPRSNGVQRETSGKQSQHGKYQPRK
ncbi:protein BEX1 isoform X2 [Macaca mulatta]